PSFIYLTFLLLLPPPRSTLFPYTTFFRSHFKSETKRLNLKGLVRANKAGCLDHCEMGPSVVIYPEGVWYWVGTEADVTEIMERQDRKSTRLNSSHVSISYAVFCLKKKTIN